MLPGGATVEVRFEGARAQRAIVEAHYGDKRVLSRKYEVVSP